MLNEISHLDAEELLHLSIKAMQSNNHDTAITYLKRTIELEPSNAQAHYLLAAEYAEIGMYDRAADGMKHALELNPNLPTTRFQLGLLHITSGNVEMARETWEALSELGDENPLYLFKEGLLKLAEDNFLECDQLLRKGIANNDVNKALNQDMERILNNIKDKVETPAAEVEEPVEELEEQPASHAFLSKYKSPDTSH